VATVVAEKEPTLISVAIDRVASIYMPTLFAISGTIISLAACKLN